MKNSLLAIFFLSSIATSFSQARLDSGLVAYYPFNGDANDASGNGTNAVFNNATLTSDIYGNPNSAYYFNGVDNYIRFPNASDINPAAQISLCVLVKPMGFYKGPCHGNSILMKGDADYLIGNYVLRFDDNAYTSQNNCFTSIVDTIHQNFYSINAQTPPPGYTPYINRDQWYCVVYTYDGTSGKFYVDGVLERTETVSIISFTNTYDLFLGKLNNASFPYWFNGILDEVRIYNRAITDDEVSAFCPLAALPIALTKFAANVIGKQIRLSWNIENEDAGENYTIERSLTGHSDFRKIGLVQGNNIHSYSFVDNSAEVDQNYFYRIAIKENTNTISYSEIKSARIIRAGDPISVYPNPSAGNIVIKIYGYDGNVSLALTNSLGQVLLKQNKIIANSLLSLNLKQSKGIYWLKIETSNSVSVQKILVF